MVSPLSPAPNITSYNPFYIMVNPTIEVHCKRIFDYVVAHHRKDNILLLTRPESTEAQYATIFQNYLNDYQAATNDYSMSITQVNFAPDDMDETDEKSGEIETFFKETEKNV